MFNRNISSAPRAARLRAATSSQRTRGYAVAIDFIDGRPHDARLVDQSPVLSIEKVERSGFDGGHRRMCAVEFNGDGAPPASGVMRHVVDAFFVDRRVAEFVWQAVIEKIENDAAPRATA